MKRIILLLFLFCPSVFGASVSHYVATNGLASNTGASGSPWDLLTAMTTNAVAAGDTVLLRGGTYIYPNPMTNTTLMVNLTGTSNSHITVKPFTNELVKLRVWVFDLSGAVWVDLNGIEFSGEDYTNNVSHQLTSSPSDILYHDVINVRYSTGITLTNCVVHDAVSAAGINAQNSPTNCVISGCGFWNVGWLAHSTNDAFADRGFGHGIYTQPGAPSGLVIEGCWLFNCADQNIQAYTQTLPNKHLSVFNMVSSDSGIIANYNGSSAEFVVQSTGANFLDDITVSNLLVYATTNNSAISFGHPSYASGAIRLWNSYIPMRLAVYNVSSLFITNNTLFRTAWESVDWYSNVATNTTGTWDYNTYHNSGGATPFFVNPPGSSKTFAQWQALPSAWDLHSSYDTQTPASVGNKVFIITNAFNPKQALVVFYNWTHANTMTFTPASFMTANATYSIRNARDLYHGVLLTNTWPGSGLITVPMTNLTMAQCVGGLTAPPPNVEFNFFLVQSFDSVTSTPPVIVITAPTNGTAMVEGTAFDFTASVTPGSGNVTNVSLLIGSTVLSNYSAAPYTLNMSTNPGSYSLSAVVQDDAGYSVTSSVVSITVTNQVIEVGSPFLMSAAVTLGSGNVTNVGFYLDALKVGNFLALPYSTNVVASPGYYNLLATAQDDIGNSVTSKLVRILVTNFVVTANLTDFRIRNMLR